MKNAKITKSIWTGSLVLALSLFLAACGDGNPYAKAENDLDHMENEANREGDRISDYDDDNEYDNSGSGGYVDRVEDAFGTHSSSSRYRQSSSSTEAEYDYLTSPMTMNFTLTHYKQTVCTVEGKGSKSCSYDDGDPRVSFEIIFYQTDGDSTKYSTRDKLGKNWFYYDDIGEWDGEKSFTVKVPAFTETIRICPYVEDDDFFGNHDRMYSNYCYLTYYIGLLDYRETTYQSDYENEYCELEWEWYLY